MDDFLIAHIGIFYDIQYPRHEITSLFALRRI
jgi:hypothetical protein